MPTDNYLGRWELRKNPMVCDHFPIRCIPSDRLDENFPSTPLIKGISGPNRSMERSAGSHSMVKDVLLKANLYVLCHGFCV